MRATVWIGLLCWLVTWQVNAQTWCHANEKTLLSGEVGLLRDPGFVPKGILSLCASPADGSMTSLTYRYGRTQPELVYSTPQDGPMWLASQQILPRAGVDILYFTKGNFTYAVTDCQGMHCGRRTLRLMVFNGTQRVLSLSANPDVFERHIDFLDDLQGVLIKPRKTDLNVDER